MNELQNYKSECEDKFRGEIEITGACGNYYPRASINAKGNLSQAASIRKRQRQDILRELISH